MFWISEKFSTTNYVNCAVLYIRHWRPSKNNNHQANFIVYVCYDEGGQRVSRCNLWREDVSCPLFGHDLPEPELCTSCWSPAAGTNGCIQCWRRDWRQ
jgi:hypothetical protein